MWTIHTEVRVVFQGRMLRLLELNMQMQIFTVAGDVGKEWTDDRCGMRWKKVGQCRGATALPSPTHPFPQVFSLNAAVTHL